MPGERAWTRRLLALSFLVALVVGWVALETTWDSPYAPLVAFAVGILALPGILALALRPSRARRKARPPPLRRHEQVVRRLPDPDAAALGRHLRAWVASGQADEALLDALAYATASTPDDVPAVRERIAAEAAAATTHRRRERFLHRLLERVHRPHTGA